MRRYRTALAVVLPMAALSLGAVLAFPSQGATQWKSSLTSATIPSQPRTDLITNADLGPLVAYAVAVQSGLANSSGPSGGASSGLPTSSAPVGPTVPTTTTTQPPAPSAASGDLLLADAPAYVVAAFHCIAYEHESGGDPTAVNPSSGDSGLYQFNVGTWLANGGGQFASQALYATVAQQDTVAYWTWRNDGFQPWDGDNDCWE